THLGIQDHIECSWRSSTNTGRQSNCGRVKGSHLDRPRLDGGKAIVQGAVPKILEGDLLALAGKHLLLPVFAKEVISRTRLSAPGGQAFENGSCVLPGEPWRAGLHLPAHSRVPHHSTFPGNDGQGTRNAPAEPFRPVAAPG